MQLNQLHFKLDAAQQPEQDLEGIRRDLRFVRESIGVIVDNLPVQRRPLSETTKELHHRVTLTRRNGYCPCCQSLPVCDIASKLAGAEFDHWYGRHRNRPDETWLVCSDCNRRLENADFKTAARSSFEAYQRALRVVADAGGQPPLFSE